MIAVECHRCDEELDEPGAVVISPPEVNGRCTKYHLCAPCFEHVLQTAMSDAPPRAYVLVSEDDIDGAGYYDDDYCLTCDHLAHEGPCQHVDGPGQRCRCGLR